MAYASKLPRDEWYSEGSSAYALVRYFYEHHYFEIQSIKSLSKRYVYFPSLRHTLVWVLAAMGWEGGRVGKGCRMIKGHAQAHAHTHTNH